MKFLDCCTVNNADEIIESYCIMKQRIESNLEEKHIKQILKDFLMQVEFPIFFFLEVHCTYEEELEFNDSQLHDNTYYLDYCPVEIAEEIINKDIDILLNSGTCQFGFGSRNRDEIYVCKYNNVCFFSEKSINRYAEILEKYNITKVEKIKTAWDTFSQTNYGEARNISINNMTYYDLIEKYSKFGMYKVK